jgi:hypothetical protein
MERNICFQKLKKGKNKKESLENINNWKDKLANKGKGFNQSFKSIFDILKTT